MRKGFTLIELLIVLGVIAILLAIIIPSFRGMQEEGNRTRAQKEVETLQTAVESYYKNTNAFPNNGQLFYATLMTPRIVTVMPADPFMTMGTDYTYATGTDGTYGNWYFVGSRGPDRAWASTYMTGAGYVQVRGDDIVATNMPKQ
jgi:general secretion pathway protein G